SHSHTLLKSHTHTYPCNIYSGTTQRQVIVSHSHTHTHTHTHTHNTTNHTQNHHNPTPHNPTTTHTHTHTHTHWSAMNNCDSASTSSLSAGCCVWACGLTGGVTRAVGSQSVFVACACE